MAAGSDQPPIVLDWGRTRYADALERQLALVASRIGGKEPDTVVLTEHEPVYTVGLRAGSDRHLVWDQVQLQQAGIEVVPTNRGGDITYHGPGQRVVYPIVSLNEHRDLHAYLRFLEDILIGTVADFNLVAGRRDGKTGIWVGTRKIAAIGVAVRRWVAYHGVALNVQPDLAHFAGIVPCGIPAQDGTVTSLAAELATPPPLAAVKAAFTAHFLRAWPRFRTDPVASRTQFVSETAGTPRGRADPVTETEPRGRT